jgi:hypothetical protein
VKQNGRLSSIDSPVSSKFPRPNQAVPQLHPVPRLLCAWSIQDCHNRYRGNPGSRVSCKTDTGTDWQAQPCPGAALAAAGPAPEKVIHTSTRRQQKQSPSITRIMSDSEAADRPSDSTISRTLRDVVIATHKSGKDEDLTVKRVRAKAEEQLGLSPGFLKTNQEWKQKSQVTILEAVVRCHHLFIAHCA